MNLLIEREYTRAVWELRKEGELVEVAEESTTFIGSRRCHRVSGNDGSRQNKLYPGEPHMH